MSPRRDLLVLHFAFMASVLVYGLVAWLLSRQPALAPALPTGPVPLLAGVLGVAFAAQAFLLVPMLTRRIPDPRRRHLVRLAIYESGAIYGLVLFFISRNLVYMAAFGGVALLLMAFCLPLESDL
ncbi:MAG TPA: hypothetical protein VNO81_05005 [Candidatus Nitrosotenuis sp.]|nr:hypothetical protein [Candidatus Nitrosotenuis sp.]